jgi:hypothetical protein
MDALTSTERCHELNTKIPFLVKRGGVLWLLGGELVRKERRRHPRIDFDLPIEVVGHEGSHVVNNLSLGGLLVETEAASDFRTEDQIDLVIKLPLEMFAIKVSSRIARVTGSAIGVELVNLLPQDAMALEHCFHMFKDTIPRPTT